MADFGTAKGMALLLHAKSGKATYRCIKQKDPVMDILIWHRIKVNIPLAPFFLSWYLAVPQDCESRVQIAGARRQGDSAMIDLRRPSLKSLTANRGEKK